MSLLSPLLYRAPPLDPRTGLVSAPWADWFASLLQRTGGPGEVPTNADLAAALAAVSPGPAALAALTLRVAALEAVVFGHQGPPTGQAGAAGAGVGATVTVTGTDRGGTITLTTVALADHQSNSDLLTVTFATPYTVAPVVMLQPANAAAYALREGRFNRHPVSVRLVQDRVTVSNFVLAVGVTSLPREAAVYAYNYVCIGV